MLKFMRQCATIQVTVLNENGVMVFDQSAGVDAPGYLEHILTEAMRHELRIVEGKIANQYFDRINALQKEVRDLKNPKVINGGYLTATTVIDAEFVALPAPDKGLYNS